MSFWAGNHQPDLATLVSDSVSHKRSDEMRSDILERLMRINHHKSMSYST